jgi:hypothetical protein
MHARIIARHMGLGETTPRVVAKSQLSDAWGPARNGALPLKRRA